MEMGLDQLRPGGAAEVTRICCPQRLKNRLADFGLVEGTRVICRYRSPGGSVTALELRGTTIGIRTGDLKQITVRRVT